MHEISTAFEVLWTIGTFVFAAGFGWAGVRYGQKRNEELVREVKRDVKEIRNCVRELGERLSHDEATYMSRADCRDEQDECAQHRTYHENQLFTKMQEIKEFMFDMDKRREETRVELSAALRKLATDLRAENDRRFGVPAV